MSKESPIIVGLDIGTTKVAAIAGRKNEFGKLEILGFGRAESSGVDHGMVVNIEQCIRSIQGALENCLINNPKLSLKEVYVGIAGRHIKSLQTRGEHVRTNAEDMISKSDIDITYDFELESRHDLTKAVELVFVVKRKVSGGIFASKMYVGGLVMYLRDVIPKSPLHQTFPIYAVGGETQQNNQHQQKTHQLQYQ